MLDFLNHTLINADITFTFTILKHNNALPQSDDILKL